MTWNNSDSSSCCVRAPHHRRRTAHIFRCLADNFHIFTYVMLSKKCSLFLPRSHRTYARNGKPKRNTCEISLLFKVKNFEATLKWSVFQVKPFDALRYYQLDKSKQTRTKTISSILCKNTPANETKAKECVDDGGGGGGIINGSGCRGFVNVWVNLLLVGIDNNLKACAVVALFCRFQSVQIICKPPALLPTPFRFKMDFSFILDHFHSNARWTYLSFYRKCAAGVWVCALWIRIKRSFMYHGIIVSTRLPFHTFNDGTFCFRVFLNFIWINLWQMVFIHS